ncbi:MAG: hypothetical protein KDD47_03055, partial [Acidobacteria bacterium]|nr:hypothetical protein [Acidobacteriota bacterium]
TGQAIFHRWAVELAGAAHRGFTFRSPGDGGPVMAWKMSTDLQRPLVSSMGHHDPLELLINMLELISAPWVEAGRRGEEELRAALADAEALCTGRSWVTEDPLGIGGLLVAAHRLGEMVFRRGLDRKGLLLRLLEEAHVSLKALARTAQLEGPPEVRLAFRELGLAIGLQAAERVRPWVGEHEDLVPVLGKVTEFAPVGEAVTSFWSDPAHRRARTWTEHDDINTVMLATSLHPAGFL